MKNTIPFVPPISGGIVIKVQENAVIIASTLPYPNSPMYRFPIRLQGIQFLENSKKQQPSPQEALEKYILYKEVTLQNMKTDTYGGIIADVYVRNRNINLWLVENKYATLYRSRKNGTPRSRI
jgi:endonuclease YncB( thermonuclease family)